MEFIKKTNILVKTKRRFVIKRQSADEPVPCELCVEQMILAQAAADFFAVSNRVIYRLIEMGNVHFTETELNEIYVCASSIREALAMT